MKQDNDFHQSMSSVVVVPKVFSPGECAFIRSLADDIGMTRAEVYEKDSSLRFSTARTCSNAWIDVLPETEWIYSKILKEITRVNFEKFRFDINNFQSATLLRYKPFQQFKWHVDIIDGPDQRKLTCVINLTDPAQYIGGQLEVDGDWENKELARNQGSAIIFPSFLRHRAKAPILGTRWSLVLWQTGGPWK